ncbi:MAG: hypothetical protein F4X89_08865 [Dehalococcoidia bacterium]|nr:hypothetical protein [Dehalococcoidia bacterium]
MTDRERAARSRARRQAIKNDGRTAAVTLNFTPDELVRFGQHVAGRYSEWPDHASVEDIMRHDLKLSTIICQDLAERPDSNEWDVHLKREYDALCAACASSICDCPRLPPGADGKDWRDCQAKGEKAWCAGRVRAAPVETAD